MDIFQIIDRESQSPCLLQDDALYLIQGQWIRIDLLTSNKKIYNKMLREIYGDKFNFDFCFTGKILIKVCIVASGHSTIWLNEKTIQSKKICNSTLPINLQNTIDHGTLEIHVLALEESAIFKNTPKASYTSLNKNQVLYYFSHPTYEVCCEIPLYYKLKGENVYFSFEDSNVYLGKNTSVSLITYFNSFSAIKWKKYTNVRNLSLYLDFKGKAITELFYLSKTYKISICQWDIETKNRSTVKLNIGRYPNIGILGIVIHAESDSVLYGGGWMTNDPETQPVHLGIGITTFKREDAVKRTVARLGKAIATDPIYHDAIDITVVDNGQTLTPKDVPAATLISNRNLGGTGGFTRSLIHYQDMGGYTHCLFMDDDASCEAGSIFRSISFLRHAKDFSSAISGAMLSENLQFLQWESGAYFDHACHPLHCNYNLVEDDTILVVNEKEDSAFPIYGAWWFFMFPIEQVKKYSFPFFVRGDDVNFSYANDFRIIHMNGVAVWQGDFKTKESPMTLYLDVRSSIALHFLLNHVDCSRKCIISQLWSFFRPFNLSYHYDTANAIASSFSKVLRGPKYWIDNIDASKIRKSIKKKYKTEINSPLRLNYKDIPEIKKDITLKHYTKFIQKISLNGHLLPKFMVQKGLNRINKYGTPSKNRMFLRDKILVYNETNKTEYILKRNSMYFLKNLFLMTFTTLRFYKKYNKLKKEYRTFMLEMGKPDFWKGQF